MGYGLPGAPIALFVYRRPMHTRRTLVALANAEGAQDSDLHIFADGSKGSRDAAAVDAVREVASAATGFRSVRLIERDQNLGLSSSIQLGVSELTSRFGRVIVLEDDVLVGRHFLTFLNRALDHYESAESVMQVAGHMFPVQAKVLPQSFFLPFVTTWGWATWERAWRKFDASGCGASQLQEDDRLRYAFNLEGAYDYWEMLQQQLSGHISSWGVLWNLSVFLNKGLVLYPRISLVANIGQDGSGVHGDRSGEARAAASDFLPEGFPVPMVDQMAYAAVTRYLRARRNPVRRLLARMRRHIA